MFYFKELYYRLIYSLLVCSITFLIVYEYRNILIYLILVPFLFFKKNYINHFIYMHPTEITKIIFTLILYISFIFIFPYLIWSIIDFLKPSLQKKEKKNFYNFFFSFFFFLFLNLILFLILFPNIWLFFEIFNYFSLKNLNLFLEVRIENYFYFLLHYFIFLNYFLCFLLFLYFFIKYIGLLYFLYLKNFFILLCVLLAIILSLPELYIQLILIYIYICFLEIIFIYFFIKLKINKVIY